MTIEQTEIIDFISADRQTGGIRLTISDHLSWDMEKQHLLLLQEKINAYIRFIESGEIYEHAEKAKDKQITIRLALKYNPSELALQFLALAQKQIEAAGIGFQYEILRETNYQT